MSEHQEQDKNRITCPAKIRTRDSYLDGERLLTNQPCKKVLRLANIDTAQNYFKKDQTPETKDAYFINSELSQWSMTSSAVFPSFDEIEMEKPDKPNFLYDSWVKTQNEDIISQILRRDLIKRPDFGDFPDFDRTMTPMMLHRCDRSFDEHSRILSSSPFETSSKDLNELTRENTFLQKTIEEKNSEIGVLVSAMNEERRSLERRIFDLEFQILSQKRSNDRVVDSLTISLKNMQAVSHNQQIQIKRLKVELDLSNTQKKKIQNENDSKISLLTKAVSDFEITCVDLRYQLEQSRRSTETLTQQKVDLQALIRQFQEEKLRKQKILLLKQGHVSLPMQIENLQQSPQSASCSDNQVCTSSQQEIQNQTGYLQSLIREYEIELSENKKKINEQKKSIVHLQSKVRNLEGLNVSMQMANHILADTNQDLLTLRLQHLNSQFQSQNIFI